MTWFDLSVPLRTGMPVYPGDPEVRIASALTVEADGANVLSLGLGSHSGTHADAPLHVGDGWAALDELPLSLFGGVAEIVDVRDVARGGAITAAHLAGIAPAGSAGEPGKPGYPGSPEKILLLHTGCAAAWGTEEYLKHPWLEAAAAQLIVDRGYRAVGLDALSVDPTSPGATHGDQQGNQDGGPAGGGFPAHDILAGNGCIIVENLTGLEQVQRATDAGSDVELFLFPLSIPGADGAPIRAVARPLPARRCGRQRPATSAAKRSRRQPTAWSPPSPPRTPRPTLRPSARRRPSSSIRKPSALGPAPPTAPCGTAGSPVAGVCSNAGAASRISSSSGLPRCFHTAWPRRSGLTGTVAAIRAMNGRPSSSPAPPTAALFASTSIFRPARSDAG